LDPVVTARNLLSRCAACQVAATGRPSAGSAVSFQMVETQNFVIGVPDPGR